MDFWWLVSAFVLVAYLVVLFHLVGDLFRDRGLGGWAKAAWMVCLIFVLYLTAVLYLVTRGRGMAERSVRAAHGARVGAEAYSRRIASDSPSEEIARAKSLLDAGTISPAEFDMLKARALSSGPGLPRQPMADGVRRHSASARLPSDARNAVSPGHLTA